MPQTEGAPQTLTAVPPQSTAQAAATPQPAVTQSAATEGAPTQVALPQTAATQAAAAPQPTVVRQYSFTTFSWLVTLAIVLALFCYGYFHVRRRRTIDRPVDEKAGDEGED